MRIFGLTTSLDQEKWRNFVYNHPHGNIFQTPEMAEVYKRTKRHEPIFLAVVDDGGEIFALMQAVVIGKIEFLGGFSARSIIQGGPLFIGGEKGMTALKVLMDYYNKIAQKKALYTQIRNMHDTLCISHIFNDLGYVYEDHLNFLVDLTRSREELWSNLSKKRRNGIRRAERKGVIIEEVEDKSLIFSFYNLLRDTYKNAKLPLADISLFESAFDLLVPKNMAKIFLAKHNDKYVGAIAVLAYNGVVYDWFAGASREYLQLYPNDILVWYAMEWGSKNGYHALDFGGAGNPKEDYGVRDFKRQFGGEMVNFGRYTKIHSSIKMKIAEKGFKIYRRLFI